MSLRNDESRCHDDACLRGHLCRRYLERNTGDPLSTPRVGTFQVDPVQCAAYIPDAEIVARKETNELTREAQEMGMYGGDR